MESLANDLSQAPTSSIEGTWFRHVPVRYANTALEGHVADGRWSRRDGFPVIYLGRPTDSVVVEAYRHLVDPIVDAPAGFERTIAPRSLITCTVRMTRVLDLRTAGARLTVGLTPAELESATTDDSAYEACRAVAAAAHQLGLHGLIAPAATNLGETLAVFPRNAPAAERPKEISRETWDTLPVDPRGGTKGHLRLVT